MTRIKFNCCLCGIISAGYGNNPQPIKKEGRCCDECNADQVIPARFELTKIMMKYGKNEEHLHNDEE